MQLQNEMIEALIKIRFKQLLRGLMDIGLIRIIILFGLLGLVAFFLFTQSSKTPNAYYVSGAYLFLITLIHKRRKDKVFIKSHFINYKLIWITEYFILLIPILFCLIFHFQWILAAITLLGLGAIVNFDFKSIRLTLNTKIQQFIPSDCFEWKAGVRKMLIPIILIWITGLFTSFFIASVPIAIFIFGLIPISFYEEGEPYQMILAYEKNSNEFLLYKIKLQIILFSILTIPLILTFLIFHIDMWYITIVEYFLFISLSIYFIFTKYAFYVPNSRSGAAKIFETFGALVIMLPILIPLIWVLTIRFYFKSHENLNFYLNDYNK